MSLAERFGRHARESRLLAIIAGEAETPHVSSCAVCQARLTELRAWMGATAGDATAIADAIFTPERLAAQKQQVLARLEAAGRSARVIAFPVGAPASAPRDKRELIQWIAAAAIGGIMVGIASGRMIDRPAATDQTRNAAPTGQTQTAAASGTAPLREPDAAALLEAAYDRVSLDSLKTIDDMTPRALEVARASMPRSRR